MRGVSTFSRMMAAAGLVSAQRTMFVFSQQSAVLEANQKTFGSESNVWLEEWEVGRLKLTVEKDAPTTIAMEKSLELFNFNDLEYPPEGIVEMPVHTSYATQKPYGKKLQLELSDRALKKGYNSKMWIAPGAVRKQNLQVKFGARPTIVLSGGTVKLYHVSQLRDGDQIARWPVSGGTRRPYSADSQQYRLLSEATALNGYATGLYYTKKQAEMLKLQPAVGQVALSIEVAADGKNALVYYNLDQLECPQAALESLNRTEPAVPSFLLSGEPVRKQEALPKHYSSMYWLSARDAQMYQFAIKASEEKNGVSLSSRTNTIDMFNAEQMTDVNEAFRVAGHYMQ